MRELIAQLDKIAQRRSRSGAAKHVLVGPTQGIVARLSSLDEAVARHFPPRISLLCASVRLAFLNPSARVLAVVPMPGRWHFLTE